MQTYSTKYWFCDSIYVDADAKVRDHYCITGKYRGSSRRDCNINVKLNCKIPVVFQNLKNFGSHLVMQEQGKFNLKINATLIGLKKYLA